MERASALLQSSGAAAVERAVLDTASWHALRQAVLDTSAVLALADAELRGGDVAAAQGCVHEALTACVKAVALLQAPATRAD